MRRRAEPLVDRVAFEVRAGEIVGIAGVAGNGQSELVEALAGLRGRTAAGVRIAGRDVTAATSRRIAPPASPTSPRIAPRSARRSRRRGRQSRDGLSSRAAARARPPARPARPRAARARTDRALRHPDRERAAPVARSRAATCKRWWWRANSPTRRRLLIAEQPTRGVDIGAIEFIHEQLVAERDQGRAVLLVSAELTEILALSDRILVMYEGRILADVPRRRGDEETARPADGGAARAAGMSATPGAAATAPAVPLAILSAAVSARCSFSLPAPIRCRLCAIVVGALAPDNLANTLNWAMPLVGMTLVAAIPLRGGMINLGGDGQMVLGALVGAMIAAVAAAARPFSPAVAFIGAGLAAGLYAALAALGEMRFRIPMLISSLLLSYPAVGVASYLAAFPFAIRPPACRRPPSSRKAPACRRWSAPSMSGSSSSSPSRGCSSSSTAAPWSATS